MTLRAAPLPPIDRLPGRIVPGYVYATRALLSPSWGIAPPVTAAEGWDLWGWLRDEMTGLLLPVFRQRATSVKETPL